MDRTQITILEQRHQMRFRCLLQCQYRSPLPSIRLSRHPILNLAHETRKRQPPEEERGRFLILAYFAEGFFARSRATFASGRRTRGWLCGGEASLGLVAGTGAAEEGFVAGASGVGGWFGSCHAICSVFLSTNGVTLRWGRLVSEESSGVK